MKEMYGSNVLVEIDHSRDELLTAHGRAAMDRQYLNGDETPQMAYARAAIAFCGGDPGLAQRIYDYASKQWLSFATPILANGGIEGALPISCYLNNVDDSIAGLVANFSENAYLTTRGGGIGTYWGNVRSIGQKTSRGVETPGLMSFMHVQDSQMLAYHQGTTRRGAAAVYVDISHPEIIEFINMRSPTGGDIHRKNENLHHAVVVTDAFMEAVEADGDWQLVDPNSGEVTDTVKARSIWIQVLQARIKLGEPFIYFTDAANRALPQSLKDKGLKVTHSNLCTEIMLPTTPDRTAVCCLSSLNVAKLPEYSNNFHQLVDDVVTMLDNVLTVFIDEAPPEMWRARNSAKKERSIGIGTLGLHTYLQDQGLAADSDDAALFNSSFYAKLKGAAVAATRRLARERGCPEDLEGTGLRNAHLLAIAPNAMSSIVCGGVSPSIEPFSANAFTQKSSIGFHEVRNPALVRYLEKIGRNTEEVWRDISLNQGSVQHLEWMGEQRDVFKTALEIDQMALVQLAAARQIHICQAQSLNLFLPADVEIRELNQLHLEAWRLGLKSLYYMRSASVKRTADSVSKPKMGSRFNLNFTTDTSPPEQGSVCGLDDDECTACEG